VHLLAGQVDEGRALLRKAIEQCVDFDYIINGLIDACDTVQQKREALQFIASELRRQTIFGDGCWRTGLAHAASCRPKSCWRR
jgi:hypothetical protein